MGELAAWAAQHPVEATAGLAAFGWIARKAYQWARRFDALVTLADRELKPNHGSSMKDSVHRIEQGLEDLNLRFDEHLKGHQ